LKAQPTLLNAQDEAVKKHSLMTKSKAGEVVIVRYEGPKEARAMQEMGFKPTSLHKNLRQVQALCTFNWMDVFFLAGSFPAVSQSVTCLS